MKELNLFGDEYYDLIQDVDEANIYTKKVDIPQYLPSPRSPHILELVDKSKTSRLIKQIQDSSVSEQEKEFLIEAAHRHSVFDYSRIADYYSHASKEMQELMELSALVIIDFDDAIANGYAVLSKNIRRIQEVSGRWASEEYANQWRNTKQEKK